MKVCSQKLSPCEWLDLIYLFIYFYKYMLNNTFVALLIIRPGLCGMSAMQTLRIGGYYGNNIMANLFNYYFRLSSL